MSNRFSISYKKLTPINIETLEKNYVSVVDDIDQNYNPFSILNLQGYNPIYEKLFDLDESNYNQISLNQEHDILDLNSIIDSETGHDLSSDVFIKFSPLLDPIRYMIGKYKADDETIRMLPKPTTLYSTDEILPNKKIMDPNNASYTDNFFSFLSNKLAKTNGFIHGLNYYGSFLGIQEKYKMNITDDLEYLNTSSYFNENVNKLFSITKTTTNEYMNIGSRGNKNKLMIDEISTHNITSISVECLEDIDGEILNEPAENELVYENTNMNGVSRSNTESSNNSKVNYSTGPESDSESESDSNSDSDSDSESGTDDEENWETESSSEENYLGDDEEDQEFTFIYNFPVQLICLEKCHGTLDRLFLTNSIDIDTGASALLQIVMILITYQKAFHFTHNDLHTNNIMYVNTDVEFLHYKYDGKYYKVPTYGKIYKIIDFGRSIYRFDGKLFCSDSFATGGDAATQYNCEPYMNENKPRLDPNYSFDLCRLGSSIYDFIIDSDEDPASFDELQKTIYRWCLDDSERNILYKRNGDERYPNFKLYKMIARTVHNHTPEMQLEYDFFKQFLLGSPVNSNEKIMDLDALPSYV